MDRRLVMGLGTGLKGVSECQYEGTGLGCGSDTGIAALASIFTIGAVLLEKGDLTGKKERD